MFIIEQYIRYQAQRSVVYILELILWHYGVLLK